MCSFNQSTEDLYFFHLKTRINESETGISLPIYPGPVKGHIPNAKKYVFSQFGWKTQSEKAISEKLSVIRASTCQIKHLTRK